MSRTKVLIFLSTIIYTLLFYEQTDGLNCLLFTSLLSSLLFISHPALLKNKKIVAIALIAVANSFAVYWLNSSWAYTMSIISLLLLSATAHDVKSSMPAAFLHSVYSTFTAPVIHLFKKIFEQNEVQPEQNKQHIKLFLLSLIPILVVFAFIQIYRFGNPIFDKYISKINVDFISFDWLFFTLSGFWLMIVFFKQVQLETLRDVDQSTPNALPTITQEMHENTYWASLINISSERYTGVLLLGLLNLVLLVVNALDFLFVVIRGELPKGVSLSAYVHDGTNAIITSVVMASLIILFYFRGYLNFDINNHWLKRLAYAWIVQNGVLIALTFYRNWLYIQHHGLTYKRIGVFVFLLLVLIGLMTIILKINKSKNNWFLFRKNAWSLYLVLAAYALVDWDYIITDYNIRQFQGEKQLEIDQRYLVGLSYTNLPQLFEFYIIKKKKLSEKIVNDSDRQFEDGFESSSFSRSYDYSQEIEQMIWNKYENLENGYANHHWPSSCYTKSKTLKEIRNLIYVNNLTKPIPKVVNIPKQDEKTTVDTTTIVTTP